MYVLLQIQGDGRGYQSLVALIKCYESLALKCLMNLCYLSTCRPLLGTAGLVECLVGILQKSKGTRLYFIWLLLILIINILCVKSTTKVNDENSSLKFAIFPKKSMNIPLSVIH
jgi:hypothetical protein